LISVIVPAYNAEDTLGACLEALLDQTIAKSEYEVIVVDDGSTDRTQEVASNYGVRLLSQPNQGPGAARNLGAHHARGDILLFTDADCVPARDWIERIVAPLADPEIAGVKGVYRTQQRSLVARFVQLEYEDKYRRMQRQRYIDFVDTYSAAYRRSVFEANGGFDPAFPRASGEDVEFSYRLSRRGYKLVFAPDAVVYHRHVDSIAGYFRRKFYVGYWRVLMYRRHPQKVIHDSHTPQTLKMQVLLAMGLPVALLGGVMWREAQILSVGLIGLFILTAGPFCIRVLCRAPRMTMVALGLLFVRAVAIGSGFLTGVIRLEWLRQEVA